MKNLKRISSSLFVALALCHQHSAAENLLDIYNVAVANDTTVQQAEAAVRGALQQHNQSRSHLLPQADLTLDSSHTEREIGNSSTNNSDWGYTLSLTQTVYNRANYDLLHQTNKLLAKAEIDRQAAHQNLIIRVAEHYFDVLSAQDNLNFAEAEIEANARQLEQTKQRFEVGLIAITDVHEAQAAHDLAVARKIAASNDLSSKIEALRELTAQYHQDISPLSDAMPLIQPEPNDPSHWANLALENNLRVVATQLALDSSKAEVKRQQAGHLPKLDLIGRHSYRDDAGASFNGDSLTDTSLTLQLSVSLYRGGNTNALIKQAESNYDQQLAELTQIRRNVHRLARDAHNSVVANISQVQALQQGIISTKSALEASQAGLEVGTRTTVDVLNTRRELFRAQRDHAKARYDYILSTLRLKEAVGTLNTQDLAAINEVLNK